MSLPPDLFAPKRFPGPSLALLTAPCWACEACRTNVKLMDLDVFLVMRVRWANASLRLACWPPLLAVFRAIDVSAARRGGCNRGRSIAVFCVELKSCR